MPNFDRFDVCEAHYLLERDYGTGGRLHERPSNRRRNEASRAQLERIGFTPPATLRDFLSLSTNGKAIYVAFILRHGL